MRKKIVIFLLVILIVIVAGGSYVYHHSRTHEKRDYIQRLVNERKLVSMIHTGDIICRKGNGIWSDLFRDLSSRDKRFSHVGMTIVNEDGHISVVHSEANDFTGAGSVYEQDLIDYMYEGDGIAIYRLKKEFNEHLPHAAELAAIMREFIGIPFDFKFDLATDNSLYCTEYVYSVYNRLTPSVDLSITTRNTKRFIPVDSCNDPQYFVEIASLDYILDPDQK